MLNGTSLSGTSKTRERIKDDYYATPPSSVEDLLKHETFNKRIWECAVGGGHIANVLEQHGYEVYGTDIVNRGWYATNYYDFVKNQDNQEMTITKWHGDIITNPPYSLAQEFLENAMKIIDNGNKVALFLKIQFLEGTKRKEMFKKYPPKTIYVFSKRQNPLRNGNPLDENGKPWSSTMCFAWFVWEKGFKGSPIIKWI